MLGNKTNVSRTKPQHAIVWLEKPGWLKKDFDQMKIKGSAAIFMVSLVGRGDVLCVPAITLSRYYWSSRNHQRVCPGRYIFARKRGIGIFCHVSSTARIKAVKIKKVADLFYLSPEHFTSNNKPECDRQRVLRGWGKASGNDICPICVGKLKSK